MTTGCDELQAFTWLRHFRDARSDEERRFARTLALDWIGREGRLQPRHLGADPMRPPGAQLAAALHHPHRRRAETEHGRQIGRSIGSQIQSLKLRGSLADDPVDTLMATLTLAGRRASVTSAPEAEVVPRLRQVHELLDAARSTMTGCTTRVPPRCRCMVMVKNSLTLRQALRRNHEQYATEFGALIDSMHRALDADVAGHGRARPISTARARWRMTSWSPSRRRAPRAPAPPALPAAMGG